jgi:hypothetical protein
METVDKDICRLRTFVTCLMDFASSDTRERAVRIMADWRYASTCPAKTSAETAAFRRHLLNIAEGQ